MSSTYTSLHYHFIFSTRNRVGLIDDRWREDLYTYIAGAFKELGARVEEIGGTADHVHILAELPTTQTVADIMRCVKRNSSAWVHRKFGLAQFAWQEGYAAFSVSASGRDQVRRYIRNQEEHHKQVSFIDELVAFLDKIGVNYDRKYLE